MLINGMIVSKMCIGRRQEHQSCTIHECIATPSNMHTQVQKNMQHQPSRSDIDHKKLHFRFLAFFTFLPTTSGLVS